MNPKQIMILILIIGLGIFSYSLTLPYYKNQKTFDDLIANYYDVGEDYYYKQKAELSTNKTVLMDLGAGIIIASSTILLFLIIKKVKRFADLKSIKSLNKKTIFISANLVWLIMLPGTYWYYLYRGDRGDYPPFADSIGIPLMTQIPVILYLIIPLNIFLLLTTIKTNLPNNIFEKAKIYNRKTILWEMFFGVWIVFNFICLISFVIDGDHFSIPINLFFTFILLSLRTGQISKKQIDENVCL